MILIVMVSLLLGIRSPGPGRLVESDRLLPGVETGLAPIPILVRPRPNDNPRRTPLSMIDAPRAAVLI